MDLILLHSRYKYRSKLSVIPLPVQPITMFDVKQVEQIKFLTNFYSALAFILFTCAHLVLKAERDVNRELFSVNNIVMDESFFEKGHLLSSHPC